MGDEQPRNYFALDQLRNGKVMVVTQADLKGRKALCAVYTSLEVTAVSGLR